MCQQQGTQSGIVSYPLQEKRLWRLAATNILTARARVGSPNASPVSVHRDILPAFAALTTDEERERKAESNRPGLYNVVVTPDSFADLPEYAAATSPSIVSRQTSTRSSRSNISSPRSRSGRTSQPLDPNVVVLERFEDAAPGLAGPLPMAVIDRRTSFPETVQAHAAIHLPQLTRISTAPSVAYGSMSAAESRLVSHFRRHIVLRLVPRVLDGLATDMLTPGSVRDMFEVESARFPPVSLARA